MARLGVAGREMGPPLWADVFTLKMVNMAVQYPSQTLMAHASCWPPRTHRHPCRHPGMHPGLHAHLASQQPAPRLRCATERPVSGGQ